MKKRKALVGALLLTLMVIACNDSVSSNLDGDDTVADDVVLDDIVVIKNETGTAISSFDDLSDAFDWLRRNAEEMGVYIVEIRDNLAISSQTLEFRGNSVRISLRGRNGMVTLNPVFTSGSLFRITSHVTLALENNITLAGSNANSDSLIIVERNGTLIMNRNTKITGNTNTESNGGGVTVRAGGEFIMNNGEISNNTSLNRQSNQGSTSIQSKGGGIYLEGHFTMNGGKIFGNVADLGGGVYSEGTAFITDGEISGNTAYLGGGVYLTKTATVQIVSGIIYGTDSATSIALSNRALSSDAPMSTHTAIKPFYLRGDTGFLDQDRSLAPEIITGAAIEYGTLNSDGEFERSRESSYNGPGETWNNTVRYLNGRAFTDPLPATPPLDFLPQPRP